jgi:choline dehydrogenase-like flavoprotein
MAPRSTGTEGLRAIDSSVFRAGNTNAPTKAMARWAADMIRRGRAILG